MGKINVNDKIVIEKTKKRRK